MKHLFFLNKYFKKYRLRLLAGVLFVALANIFGVLPPQVVRHAFDLVKENIVYYRLFSGFEMQSEFYGLFSSMLVLFGLAVLVLALIKGAFMFLMRQTIIVMSRLMEFDFRNDIYAHYQSLDIAFYKRHRTGDLMSRITEDVNRVRMYLGPAIMYSVNLVVLIVIVVATMFRVNAELTLYVLIPLPLLSFSIYYVNQIINKRSEIIQKRLSGLTSVAQEAFSGIRVLKAYVQEEANNAFFERESEDYKKQSLKLARVQAMFFPLMLSLIGVSTILTIYVGGLQVINGKLTPGNIAEFVLYVNMLTWPVTSIGWVASIIQRAAASQKRINEFLLTKPAIVSPKGEMREVIGNIRFDKVSFVYPDTGIRALSDVSFELKQGQKMAVIGRTGSGKTTIAELLTRKYDATEGAVLLDGHDLRSLPLAQVRKQIGYVPQDVFLFSDTVRNNITFGKPDATKAEIQQAAVRASVWNDIKQLPDGLNTITGERGLTLSGGQKQRISLARALIKNPKIILLDDCLSAVDAATEHDIIEQLNSYLHQKTAIVITHRIFALMSFDHILVLEQGRLAEQGTHEQLLEMGGIYAELYEKQRLEDKKMRS